jgi:hypothetical protein
LDAKSLIPSLLFSGSTGSKARKVQPDIEQPSSMQGIEVKTVDGFQVCNDELHV